MEESREPRKDRYRTLLWLVGVAVVACLLIGVTIMKPFQPTPPGPGPHPPAQSDQTSITRSLNEQIKEGGEENGLYKGGKGILVRIPDTLSLTDEPFHQVVRSTFWVNDIKTPSQLRPSGNPLCPHGTSDGYQDLSKCDEPAGGPWNFATVAAVLGVDGMHKIIKDFSNIQSKDWGWGVFYATDAHSETSRCRYIDDPAGSGWDCPGYFLNSNGSSRQDANMQGAGVFSQGNPVPPASLGGGGAGCHFDTKAGKIDQEDAINSHKEGLVQDRHCQCNYKFNTDWKAWVQNWIQNSQQKPGFEWRDWLHGRGKAPSWAVNGAICWVNNPRDMIAMQNAIYATRDQWNNEKVPLPDASHRRYFGWNEVPVTRTLVDDPGNWDAMMIKLPATICGGPLDRLDCLSGAAKQQLEKDIDVMVTKGKVLPGLDHITSRPGSYMVVVREFETGRGEYARQFFCENWMSPGGKFRLVFSAEKNESSPGLCFLDHGNVTVMV